MYSAKELTQQDDNIQPWHTPFLIWNQSVVPCPVLLMLLDLHTDFSGGRSGGLVFPSLGISTVCCDPHNQRLWCSQWSRSRCFLEFSSFFYDPTDVDILVSGSSTFSKSSCIAGNSRFTYCWSLSWGILSITLLACEMSAVVWQFKHSLALPLFGIGMKTDLFQSCGHCWVFQICWHIGWSTLTASSFRIWNNSAGIPSPPLTLFVVMFSKDHLPSQSRMSGSRWVTIPSWWSGSLRSFFVQFFRVFFSPVLNIFCFY